MSKLLFYAIFLSNRFIGRCVKNFLAPESIMVCGVGVSIGGLGFLVYSD